MGKNFRKVVLAGAPNVGKSVIFNALTGAYATVSNYPGTTVDVSRGSAVIKGKKYEVVDTPGMYSLIPITEEERVARDLIFTEKPDVIVHVVDAKNLRRMLPVTFQFLDAGLPVILDLNIMDEAEELGMIFNISRLSELLGIPVVATAAARKVGLEKLKQAIAQYNAVSQGVRKNLEFDRVIEEGVALITAKLRTDYTMTPRLMALLLMQGDQAVHRQIRGEKEYGEVLAIIENIRLNYDQGMDCIITLQRQAMADKIFTQSVRTGKSAPKSLAGFIGRVTREPITGLPILLFVLYFGLYKFVGKFGAGTLVEYIDTCIFEDVINPFVFGLVQSYLPWEWIQSMIVGEYGIFTLGFRYAVAIILPIVGTFFLTFAILEDSGYLPRLAMLVNGLFQHFGLNGRAVIPITLGLGCGTMAVMVTRTLETRRERLLATFLLALTVPCSAQLGVVMALLSHNATALIVWLLYVIAFFYAAGWLSARLIPGQGSRFYIELPPMRMPVLSNVIIKAYNRMWWYFVEITPVFVFTSLLLWFSHRFDILPSVVRMLEPLTAMLGLPPDTAWIFLFGFLRRDYGAAGLYDMAANGRLTDWQLVVACVTLTLFVPCIAQFTVMIKERGTVVSVAMVILIAILAFSGGVGINWLLRIGQII